MPTTVTVQTPAGPFVLAAGKPMSLVAGQTVTIVVAPGVPVTSVNFNNTAGPKVAPLGPKNWATSPPWSYAWTVPPVGTPVLLQVELRAHDEQAEPPAAYPITIVAGVATPASPAKPPLSETPPNSDNVADGEAVKLIHVPFGFACSGSDDPAVMRAGLKRIAADGGGVVRIWHGGFSNISANVLTLIDAAVSVGLHVILTVNLIDKRSDPKTTKFGVPDIAGWVARNEATLRKCAFVEAGNELNINQYRPDDFGDSDHWQRAYVARWLQPLSTALTAIGVGTLCASITGDSFHPEVYGRQLAKLVTAGAAKYCVGFCVHCYWHADKIGAAGTLVPMLTAAQATCGVPVHITEAGLDGSTPEAVFPAAIVTYLQDLRRAAVASISVYRGGPHPIWPASRSLFDAAGQPTAIYPVVIGALKS